MKEVAYLPPAENGPAADYPIVIGEAFNIDGETYTPADTLNFDAVGYAEIGDTQGGKVTGARKTLPLPSYVEVTALETGKTILVRLETRGPMNNESLIGLSPAAAAQIGFEPGSHSPVRVRRVNPPEVERALLRNGEQAPARMDTPKALLTVLKRKLDEEEPLKARPAVLQAAAPAAEPVLLDPVNEEKPVPAIVAIDPSEGLTPAAPAMEPAPVIEPTLAAMSAPSIPASEADPSPAASVPTGPSMLVQAAAFSTAERAEAAAAKLADAHVSKPGKYWLLRLGPFENRQSAEAALAKAKLAGYEDARIQQAH